MSGPLVALAIDAADWHVAQLARAAGAAGVDLRAFRLADAAFDTTAPHGLALPGFGQSLPDAVLVRAISAGSFEQVTRRLGILHALRDLGVPVLNDARAIERCVDKSATSALLARAGLPTPPTWTVEGRDAARVISAQNAHGDGLVCKPLFGAQGRGLRRVHGAEDLPASETVGDVYHLQGFIASAGDGFRDHRLFVIGSRVVAAMTRHGTSWVTNLRQGGRPEPFAPPLAMAELAICATSCVGADYAGVDIVCDRAGVSWVLEVNSMPGWRGLQGVTVTNLAAEVLGMAVGRAVTCRA